MPRDHGNWDTLTLGERINRAAWMAVHEHRAAEDRAIEEQFAAEIDGQDFGADQAAGLRRLVALYDAQERNAARDNGSQDGDRREFEGGDTL
jgi:hypothetical protein